MEFSIKAGWVGPRCPGFPLKKKNNMVLKHFILPVDHFKANLFFSHYDPPSATPPLSIETISVGNPKVVNGVA